MEKAEVGQVVFLNSGGDPLTVMYTEGQDNACGYKIQEGECQCGRHNKGVLEYPTFNLSCLSATNPYPDKYQSVKYDTLADLRQMFPNVKWENIKPKAEAAKR